MTQPLSSESKQFILVSCPNPLCQLPIIILKQELACAIARCGVYKSNGQPIPPHSSKDECEKLVKAGLVFGCGCALEIKTVSSNPEKFEAKLCEYK